LPFEAEPLESLRERYPRAIADLVDVESVNLGLQYDPGSERKHVFDTEDGIRLIISREDQGEDGKVIHFSASLGRNFPPVLTDEGTGAVLTMLENRFREISGYQGEFGMGVTAPDGIPHWYIFEHHKKHPDPKSVRFQ
jgi:hypothetical protein